MLPFDVVATPQASAKIPGPIAGSKILEAVGDSSVTDHFSAQLAEETPLVWKGQRRQFFKGRISTLLIQLYFLTAVLANFPRLLLINHVLLAVLVTYGLVHKRPGVPAVSPLIALYAVVTAISVFNHLRWMPEAGLPQAARTMPIVLVTMVAVRTLTVPGLFARSVALNALPFLVLLPLGGHYMAGRYYSAFLNENLHGQALPLAFAVGAVALFAKRYRPGPFIALAASLLYMLLGASRKLFLYLVAAALTLFVSVRKRNVYRIVITAVALVAMATVVIPTMTSRQHERLGSDFSWYATVADFVSGETSENSSRDRRAFIELAFTAAERDWLGFGNGNFGYVVRSQGPRSLPEAAHPHSGLAESLITGGYVGLLLYVAMIVYLGRIGRRDPVMRMILVWLVIEFFAVSTFANRVLWPLLAMAERELQVSKATGALEGDKGLPPHGSEGAGTLAVSTYPPFPQDV